MAGGLGWTPPPEKKKAAPKPTATHPGYKGSGKARKETPYTRYGGKKKPPPREATPLGSPQSGPPNPFKGMFTPPGGGPTPGGGGGGGAGGAGGGGGGAPGPGGGFDFSKFKQDIKPNEYQTGAYKKMEDLYEEVPDYFERALAQSRMAGSEGLESELSAAGRRGFGPGSGFTGDALADYGRKLNQQIMGGQMDAAQQTFQDRMGLSGQMGGLGTNIAGNLAQLYGQNIGAYNAMANYALGNERNQINWYDAQTRAQQGWMNPMMNMMNMFMQSGMAFI